MDIEIAKEKLKVIDIKFFLNGMTEQSNYIVDKADEINIAIETVLSELEKKDKVINLMIEEGSHIPENELYKVEKIYREVKDKTELKGRDLKLYCIKEYFTNKVG